MGFLRKERQVPDGCGLSRWARATAHARAKATQARLLNGRAHGARRGPVAGAGACDVRLDRMPEAAAGFGRRDAAGQEGGTRVTRLRAAVRRLPSRVESLSIATG
ncbi:hypothetical protein [Burkholderia cepacia]|uniref:hypothetical protein n=1 Tax=Burkholderia cepacia TaxID=292 RepID=UPI0012D8B73D|nr:hypothetical protein [Burkholderia cepacia]